MRKLKIYIILTILVISSFLLISINSTQSINIVNDVTKSDLAYKFNSEDGHVEITLAELIDTSELNKNFESLEFGIFGYSLKVEDVIPLDYDEFGQISLIQEKLEEQKDTINIDLILKSGEFFFQGVPVTGELYIDMDNNEFYKYTIENPRLGFFMSIDIYPELTKIDLAFDGGDRQLYYEGLIDEGFSSYNAYLTSEISVYSVESNDGCLTPTSTLSFSEQKEKMMYDQVNGVTITKDTNPDPIKSAGITTYKYGLIHNVAFGSDDDPHLEWICDEEELSHYMSTYCQIQTVIATETNSQNLIKSDLQYYNKDSIDAQHFTGYVRNVLAYSIYSHGWIHNSYWLVPDYYNKLYPSEIEDLWYNDEVGLLGIDVFPTDMIILAKSCWGLGGPIFLNYDMADAFLDYGATAFCGVTVADVAWSYMDYKRHSTTGKYGFWGSLCYFGLTVEEAAENLVLNHNELEDESDWEYEDEFRVIGDEGGTIP